MRGKSWWKKRKAWQKGGMLGFCFGLFIVVLTYLLLFKKIELDFTSPMFTMLVVFSFILPLICGLENSTCTLHALYLSMFLIVILYTLLGVGIFTTISYIPNLVKRIKRKPKEEKGFKNWWKGKSGWKKGAIIATCLYLLTVLYYLFYLKYSSFPYDYIIISAAFGFFEIVSSEYLGNFIQHILDVCYFVPDTCLSFWGLINIILNMFFYGSIGAVIGAGTSYISLRKKAKNKIQIKKSKKTLFKSITFLSGVVIFLFIVYFSLLTPRIVEIKAGIDENITITHISKSFGEDEEISMHIGAANYELGFWDEEYVSTRYGKLRKNEEGDYIISLTTPKIPGIYELRINSKVWNIDRTIFNLIVTGPVKTSDKASLVAERALYSKIYINDEGYGQAQYNFEVLSKQVELLNNKWHVNLTAEYGFGCCSACSPGSLCIQVCVPCGTKTVEGNYVISKNGIIEEEIVTEKDCERNPGAWFRGMEMKEEVCPW